MLAPSIFLSPLALWKDNPKIFFQAKEQESAHVWRAGFTSISNEMLEAKLLFFLLRGSEESILSEALLARVHGVKHQSFWLKTWPGAASTFHNFQDFRRAKDKCKPVIMRVTMVMMFMIL